ncbi:MAG: V-type ATPase subunit [Oscillospiraceae bacterium]|jgi:V/A-type H+-transporting ATPase subunit C|nr:V-type ATPase subunit [Oscillospiraceae bacterium]
MTYSYSEKKKKSRSSVRDADFLHIGGMTAAREAAFLSRAAIDRLISADDFADAARILREAGYPDFSGMALSEIEAELNKKRADEFYGLARISGVLPVLDIFRAKYDYDNVKVLVKAMQANTDGGELLSACGRVPPEVLTNVFISGDRRDLPGKLADAISRGVAVLSKTRNPGLSDTEIDRLYFEELCALASAVGTPRIAGYVAAQIDAANIKTFIRSAITNRPPEFLENSLLPSGSVPQEAISAASGADGLISACGRTDILTPRVAEAIRAAFISGRTGELERLLDSAPYGAISPAKLTAFGADRLVLYLARFQYELSAVLLILGGKLAGLSPEELASRLREFDI